MRCMEGGIAGGPAGNLRLWGKRGEVSSLQPAVLRSESMGIMLSVFLGIFLARWLMTR